MYLVPEGRATYGHSIGVIMQHDGLARLPGDVGNLTTFSFPVTYCVVSDFPMDAMKSLALREYAGLFIDAARYLESMGCVAITAGCGFLALLQPVLAEAVQIPVLTSALIQVPFVSAMLRKKQKVGIITASSTALCEEHFNAVGWSSRDIPISVIGIEEDASSDFRAHNFGRAARDLEMFERIEASMARLARSLVQRDPTVGAIVFECTNMPPYADAVQKAVNLPVFDIVTLINTVHEAVTRTRYHGHM